MSIFEQASSRPGTRFGKLSSNMFFTRNTAKPKRVRHIEGLNGALICNVNDDPALIRSTPSSSLSFNKVNMPTLDKPRRMERVVPPMGFWNTFGVIHDTDRWKRELASLATASGLGVEKDEHRSSYKPPTATVDQQHASRSGAHYSMRTGRFNEGTARSRGRTGSRQDTANLLYRVPENEREMWMLQVLCQLLGTSHLEEVQSWLVSASPAEKEQARAMIYSALRGLKESERASNEDSESVDFNSLSNLVEKQRNEEKHATQKYIQNTLNRSAPVLPCIDEEQQSAVGLNETWNNGEQTNDYRKPNAYNTTTYKRAYQNFNERSYSSFDGSAAGMKNDPYEESELHQQDNYDDENIDTIQLDDDRQRPRSASLSKSKIQTRKSETPMGPPPSSHKQKHRIESIEFNDNSDDVHVKQRDEHKTKQHNSLSPSESRQRSEMSSSSQNLRKPLNEEFEQKSRKIRDLQTKLSRQEEQAKKKFDELQTKQSRLENALKLLVKQTSTYKKRREPTRERSEDLDTPIVNVIIQSPRDNSRRQDRLSDIDSLVQPSETSIQMHEKMNRTGKNNTKFGDYAIQDVKVQINLSRLDNPQAKVYSGVWKPDISTLHRLQGN